MIANVALPSFLPHSLSTLAGIFVIASIEGWFLARCIGLGFKESYKLSLIANWNSTIAGIPLAWLLWVARLLPVTWLMSALQQEVHPALASTFLQSGFFGGIMPNEWSRIGFASAWILMLVPFWFGSVWIEKRTILKHLPKVIPERISTAVVRGNLASYSIFLVFGIYWLSNAIADYPDEKIRFEKLRVKREVERRDREMRNGATAPVNRIPEDN